MPLRPSIPQDLAVVIDIYATAFYDEEFMGALMRPHSQSFPEDYCRYREHRIMEWFGSYIYQLIVAYTVEQTGAEKKEAVRGIGDWIQYDNGS